MKKAILITAIIALFAVPAFAFDGMGPGVQANANVQAQQGQALIDNSSQSITSKGAPIPRGFAVPGDITFPAQISHFERALPTGNVQPMKHALMFRHTFSHTELLNFAEHEKCKVIAKPLVKKEKKEEIGGTKTIDIVLLPKGEEDELAQKYMMVGHITVLGKKPDTTSVGALAQAALAAQQMGATVLLVTGEGASRIIKGTAWGIMIGSSTATINGTTGDVGTISTGGIGWGTAEAGYKHIPWLQCFALVPRK